MPAAWRFSLLPVIVTSSAAAGGLLGAFVAVGLLSPTASQKAKVASPSVQEVKSAEAAETTGSAAPSESSAAAADCDKQTWPYLSRPCAEELQRKNRSVRVIATDRVDHSTIGAIEKDAPSPQQTAVDAKTQAAASPEAVAATTPAADPLPVAVTKPWFNPAAPAATPMPATSSPPAATAAATTAEEPKVQEKAQEKAQEDSKPKSKQVARKAKPRPKPKMDSDDDNRGQVASSDDDGEAAQDRAVRPQKPRRRIVERWIERDEGPSDDNGAPRVVVTHRGGPFENLFGLNRARAGDDDDDD